VSSPHPSIAAEPFDSELSQWLVRQAELELEARYGYVDESERGLRAEQFGPPGGAFLVARVDPDDIVAGGVGLRRVTSHTAEVKRLWVHPDWRGRGIARGLMAELELVARRLGHTALRLETGEGQPEAVALYASAGWSRQDVGWQGGPIRCGSIHFSKALD
jgi:GNAT superfamily N-acetyltransferase